MLQEYCRNVGDIYSDDSERRGGCPSSQVMVNEISKAFGILIILFSLLIILEFINYGS